MEGKKEGRKKDGRKSIRSPEYIVGCALEEVAATLHLSSYLTGSFTELFT